MRNTHKTTVQAIHYLLKKTGKLSSARIAYLIYLSDIYHLGRYGRTITGDSYYRRDKK